MIYLDNAASTWPKPPQVAEIMSEVIRDYAANPGRSGHFLARKAESQINGTRTAIAKLFKVKNPKDIIFTQNATESLNLALKGFLTSGDHVVTTSFEHNSVRRPLEYLRKKGVNITYVKITGDSKTLLENMESAIKETTKLVVVTHASNLTGSILPIEEISFITHKKNVPFLVDASQTAGFCPIDVETFHIDLLAFTGHKSLYGPQGTGGLYIHPEINLVPLMHGGTGGHSELIDQPPERPDHYESGTRNTVGIAGLGAGLKFIADTGIDQIRRHEEKLTQYLVEEMSTISGITIYGRDSSSQPGCPIVSFAVAGYDSNEVGFILDTNYQIAVRAGLHCSPLAHETLGTLENGLIRVSLAYFNTEQDVQDFVKAIKEIAE